MKNGGVITITTNLLQDISLMDTNNQVVENSPYLELSVSDTGEGISEQNKKKIFDSLKKATQRRSRVREERSSYVEKRYPSSGLYPSIADKRPMMPSCVMSSLSKL